MGIVDELTSRRLFPAPETKTKMAEQEHEQSMSTPSDVNLYGSMIAGTESANLLQSFTVVTVALDRAKDLFGSSFLSLPKINFCERIIEEVGDDEEVLRYARDLLFATTKRKKKLNSSYTMVERKAGEGLIDKLVKDIYEIFSHCECGRESLPKSLAKDNGQSVVDVEGLALSVQETIKSTIDESALLIKESAAEIQKNALDASLTDLKSFLTAEINRHKEHLQAIRSDLDSV